MKYFTYSLLILTLIYLLLNMLYKIFLESFVVSYFGIIVIIIIIFLLNELFFLIFLFLYKYKNKYWKFINIITLYLLYSTYTLILSPLFQWLYHFFLSFLGRWISQYNFYFLRYNLPSALKIHTYHLF